MLKKVFAGGLIIITLFAVNIYGYSLEAYSISSGGKDASSAGYSTNFLLGTIAGNSTSTSYSQYLGFWFGAISADQADIGRYPNISFVSPTPADGNVTSNDYAYINVSASDNSNFSAFIDWNKTLVGWWSFEYVLSNGTIYDNSTYSNDGLMYNFSSNTTVTAIRGQGIEFDGVDDYIHVDSNMAYNNMTWEGWIYPKETNGYIASEGIISTGLRARLSFSSNKLSWGCYDGAWYDVLSDNNIPSDEWSHFAIVVNSGVTNGTKMYINGVEQSQKNTSSGCSPYGTFYLGTYIWPLGNYFNGTMDEIKVWKRILSPEEINASINAAIQNLFNNFTNLTNGNYSFKAWAIDQAGNINSTEERTVTINSSNNQPYISDIQNLGSQSITEGGSYQISFWVVASDANGVGDLNDNSMNASFRRVGESTRTDTQCSWASDLNSTAANYTCAIDIWYWDGAGTWNVSAQIDDQAGNTSAFYYESFTLLSTISMNFTNGTLLTWTGLGIGSKNTTADQNASIYNIANTQLSVAVNASDLVGLTTSADKIFAENFSIDYQSDGCSGTQMQNNTETTITGMTINAGNNTAGQGIEQLVTCLNEIPPTISIQTYQVTKRWIVKVS